MREATDTASRAASAPRRSCAAGWVASLLSLSACASWTPEAFFPEDYVDQMHLVRTCYRGSHPGQGYMTVWADDAASAARATGAAAYPQGATMLKVEHGDSACSEIMGFAAMRKGPAGTSAESGDWLWQAMSADIATSGAGGAPIAGAHCQGCHIACQPRDWVCSP